MVKHLPNKHGLTHQIFINQKSILSMPKKAFQEITAICLKDFVKKLDLSVRDVTLKKYDQIDLNTLWFWFGQVS